MTLVTPLINNHESPIANRRSSTIIIGDDGDDDFRKNEESSLVIFTGNEVNLGDPAIWRTNLFMLYARVFRIMLAKWKESMENARDDEKSRELDDLILPSNEQWRYQVYYRLVDLQRQIDLGVADNTLKMNVSKPEVATKEEKPWEWEPSKRDYPLRPKSGNVDESIASLAAAINDTNGSMTEARVEPGWRISDIILAAEVLQGDSPLTCYSNEAEMRRVFGLVYDVLRYKQILNQALRDVGFWYRYSEHKKRERIVWLLLYDMQGRKFSPRAEMTVVEKRERAFREASIKDIEDALIETRTHLAASVSRLRIGGSALGLDELLPAHLRTAEGVNWSDESATLASGWVNTTKITSKAEFIGEMAKLELRLCVNCNVTELDENHYVFDPICPKVVNLHDRAREKLAMSDLVTSHRFVFLERSLCLGAAALAQTIRCERLCGPVVQTHSIAPRHTAYLAGLIDDIEDAGRLLAFGTGEQRQQYEDYLGKLGVTSQQCRVFSEKYVTHPPLAELERATVVLASPPCSYTGVRDVVDLAVARGGDTRLLETLTNIDIEPEHPQALLTEQLTTLKYALTRPNVQLLVYEAHSILPSETFEMIEQVVQYANQMATDKYSREHPPKKNKPSSRESPGKTSRIGKSVKRSQDHKIDLQEERQIEEDEETVARLSADFEVPESDIFEIGRASDVFGETSKWMDEGCYLAVIKRKEMMQFNSLFMIKVAESRGLFGAPANKQELFKDEQRVVSPIRQGSQNSSRKAFKRPKIQIDRIAAETYSSMLRSSRGRKSHEMDESVSCPRHKRHVTNDEVSSSFQISRNLSTPIESSRPSNASPAGSLNFDQTQSKVKRILSSKPTRQILNERTSKKDSKLVISSKDGSNRLQSLTLQQTPSWKNQFSSDRKTFSTKTRDYGNSSTFSFGYGAQALATATRKISAIGTDPSDVSDKENSWQYQTAQPSTRNVSRTYHPGGSLRLSRLETGNSRTQSAEYFPTFPYLFPGTENAAAETAAGLDISSNN